MATITPSNTSGAAVTFAAASAGGDTVAFGSASRPVILVNNASGSAVTVTLTAVNACSQNFLHNQSASCPAGAVTEIVPNAAVIDGTSANRGNVLLTYSATASVTVGGVAS
jgi:hypothetical protein